MGGLPAGLLLCAEKGGISALLRAVTCGPCFGGSEDEVGEGDRDGRLGWGCGGGGEEGAGAGRRRTPARPAPRSVRAAEAHGLFASGAAPPHPRFLWVRSRPFRAGSACHVRRASPSRQPGPLPAAAAAGPPAHWPAGLPGFSPCEWLSF